MSLEDQIAVLLVRLEEQSKEIEQLVERVAQLEKENKELRRRLNLDSGNSSKPPRSDTLFKRTTRPSRKKSHRNPGGQPGHKGSKLKKFEKIDGFEDHHLEECPLCQSAELEIKDCRIRQEVDIPEPKIEVIEHYVYAYQCNGCGQKIKSDRYTELQQEVQYGPRLKGLVNYLNVYQLIPYKRLTELLEAIYGHRISQGSISNFNKDLSNQLQGFMAQMKDTFRQPDKIIHSDETGCMVSKALFWVHVYSDQSKTLLEGHAKRGRQAIDDIGILKQAKGILIHDRFCSYKAYDQVQHGLCNAHLLRDLKAIEDKEALTWPTEIKKLLLLAKQYKDKNDLPLARAKSLQVKYESILRKQRPYYQQIENQIKAQRKGKGRYKRGPDHNLFKDMWIYRNQILLFMYHNKVPFDNNLAERDLRMFKVKMKISNQFKSIHWVNVHASIRSFISTAVKQRQNILHCLTQAHINPHSSILLAV